MPLPAEPRRVIVPIAATAPTGEAHDVLGTAFFVAPHVLMSAKHVLGVTPDPPLELVAVDFPTEVGVMTEYVLDQVYLHPGYDIALARIDGWPRDDHLELAPTDELHMNRDILSIEYSGSTRRLMPDGTSGIVITTNWHRGHAVRDYITDLGQEQQTHVIDVSYPALRRASGAPVVQGDESGYVQGLIVANVERHLLPAHLERIQHDDGVVEELRYFLPNAQAIRAGHLRGALAAGLAVLCPS